MPNHYHPKKLSVVEGSDRLQTLHPSMTPRKCTPAKSKPAQPSQMFAMYSVAQSNPSQLAFGVRWFQKHPFFLNPLILAGGGQSW